VVAGGVAFGLGVVGGFGWALLRRHPPSPYRLSMEELRIARAEQADT
jgi:hypothetical protein